MDDLSCSAGMRSDMTPVASDARGRGRRGGTWCNDRPGQLGAAPPKPRRRTA